MKDNTLDWMTRHTWSVAIVFATIAVLLLEGFSFFTILYSGYKTPWYSTNWFMHPATNLILFFHNSEEKTVLNMIKTERWRIREVTVGDVVFWTILKREQLDEKADPKKKDPTLSKNNEEDTFSVGTLDGKSRKETVRRGWTGKVQSIRL